MINRMVVMLGLLLGLISTAWGQEAGALPRIEELTGLVPRGYTSVLVANGPFDLPRETAGHQPSLRELVRALAVGLPGEALEPVRAQAGGSRVLQAVAAAPAQDDAPGIYNGIHMVLFAHPLTRDPVALLNRLRDRASSPSVLEGQMVVSQSRTADGARYTLYYALPRDNLLICASSYAGLAEVLHRSADGSSGVDLPPALASSAFYVNTAGPAWAVRAPERHAEIWRTTPRRDWPDAMLFELQRSGRGRLQYLASDGSLLDRVKGAFKGMPVLISEQDFGLVKLVQGRSLSAERFFKILLRELGYSTI